MEKSKRICIIGAGASGICTLKAFAYYKAQMEANGNTNGEIFPEIICYEQMAEPAGIWNYTWRTGTDPTGRILHSAMYSDLYINIPKECMELPDYTFEEHIGFNCPSFIPRGMCKDYLHAYLEKSGMKHCVQFSTRIEEVTYSKETKIFTVKTCDLKTKSIITKEFDYVAVCAGHLVLPFIPEYPGFDTTDIRIIHSRDIRSVDEYRGRRVMVMGSSLSGEDLCCLLLKNGVKKIVLSYRSSKGIGPVSAQDNKWGSEALVTAPGLVRVVGETCHFVDGSTHDVDVIILCTGYKHSYEFLQQDLIVEPVNVDWPLNLYKGVLPLTADKQVPMGDSKLYYVGTWQSRYTWQSYYYQGFLVRDMILGRVTIPSAEEQKSWHDVRKEKSLGMLNDLKGDDLARRNAIKSFFNMATDYMREIDSMTDAPKMDWDACESIWFEFGKRRAKCETILDYRDEQFRSLFTGNVAPTPLVKWKDETCKDINKWVARYKP